MEPHESKVDKAEIIIKNVYKGKGTINEVLDLLNNELTGKPHED